MHYLVVEIRRRLAESLLKKRKGAGTDVAFVGETTANVTDRLHDVQVDDFPYTNNKNRLDSLSTTH